MAKASAKSKNKPTNNNATHPTESDDASENKEATDATPVAVEVVTDDEKEEEKAQKDNSEENSSPLTEEEKELLGVLEKQLHNGMLAVAQALKEIKEKKLYREDYTSFEAYCIEQMNRSERYINYLIDFATTREKFQLEHNVPLYLLPTSEAQIRPLKRFKDEKKQKEVWLEACEEAGDNVPSREIVQKVIQARKNNEQKPKEVEKLKKNTCIRVLRTNIEEFKDRVGYWGFVDAGARSGIYNIRFPDKKITGIPREALQKVELDSDEIAVMNKLFNQLQKVYKSPYNEEPVVKELLRYFGKRKEASFTELEKKMLTLIQTMTKA